MNLTEALEKALPNLKDPKDEYEEGMIKGVELCRKALGKIDVGNLSDGYHTFNELYDHRVILWINLVLLQNPKICYLVEDHYDGWFLLGVETKHGQISYHCPNKYLGLCKDIPRRHPEFDGHTSMDVIDRLEAISNADIFKVEVEDEL